MPDMLQFLKELSLIKWFFGNFTTFFLVELLTAFIIFAVFLVFRNFFTRYIIKFFTGFTGKTKTVIDDHFIVSYEKPLRLFWVLLGIYLALLYLPLNPVHNLLLSRFFRSSVIILSALGLYNLVGCYNLLHKDMEKLAGLKLDPILVPFMSKVLKVVIAALTISIVAQEWEYDVNGFVAGLGLGGLAFALAAKDTVSNIFGGIVIITDKPFSIGDWIHAPSVEGIVEDINFRSTKIRTFAQALVTVPNATLANEPVSNWTRMGIRRVTFKLGVTYTTPRIKIETCVDRIRSMLETHPEIYKDFIMVRFDSFNDSSLDIFLYFFTNTTNWAEYLRIKEDINFRIMDILEEEGVSIAFPSTSVYFETPLEKTQ